jgi:DNA-directed RNA polymerase subunit alpha
LNALKTQTDESYGKYVCRAIGARLRTTLGNSLRRVLLSSLPGTAVTSIKKPEYSMNFQPYREIKEDLTEIVLNNKEHHRKTPQRRTEDRLY